MILFIKKDVHIIFFDTLKNVILPAQARAEVRRLDVMRIRRVGRDGVGRQGARRRAGDPVVRRSPDVEPGVARRLHVAAVHRSDRAAVRPRRVDVGEGGAVDRRSSVRRIRLLPPQDREHPRGAPPLPRDAVLRGRRGHGGHPGVPGTEGAVQLRSDSLVPGHVEDREEVSLHRRSGRDPVLQELGGCAHARGWEEKSLK